MSLSSGGQATAVACIATAGAIAGLVYLIKPIYDSYCKQKRIISQYAETMSMPVSKMRAVRDDFLMEVEAGLAGQPSSLLMLPSMIDILPTGHETGDFFAIDIGGTNMRMVYVQLDDARGGVKSTEMADFKIPDTHFTVPVEKLFDLMASRMIEFTTSRNIPFGKGKVPVIGFCFSFPCDHTSFDSGILLKLTKRFENPGAVGVNPTAALTAAFARLGVTVRVAALLNDAVGTLAGGRYSDQDVLIGMIVGTGTNACYVEQVSKVKKLKPKALKQVRGDIMLINTEWGNFNSDNLILTDADKLVDASSPNAGQYLFEKQMSGMYLGEVARYILKRLATEAELFGRSGKLPEKLGDEWGFPTAALSAIVHDRTWNLSTTRDMITQHLGIQSPSYLARLQMGKDCPGNRVAITVDGGMYEHFKAYRGYVQRGLVDLLGAACASQVTVRQLREASSFGAAFLAAAAQEDAPPCTAPAAG